MNLVREKILPTSALDLETLSLAIYDVASMVEIRTLVKEILQLPRLEMLHFENFTDEELEQLDDLLVSAAGDRFQ